MREYNPIEPPDPGEWESLDEQERIELVRMYHEQAGADLPNEQLHAVVHVVVENQIALGDKTPVEGTLHRLVDEGLDRHDAIHSIGSVLARHLFELLKGDETGLDTARYFAELEGLTAAAWLSGDEK